ncbi:MAG: hypothetical protein ACRDL9_07020, partial [Trebonia sp.]
IILATIPVGIAGLALEHDFRVYFSKPILTALFLALNGVILLARRAGAQAGGSRWTSSSPRRTGKRPAGRWPAGRWQRRQGRAPGGTPPGSGP